MNSRGALARDPASAPSKRAARIAPAQRDADDEQGSVNSEAGIAALRAIEAAFQEASFRLARAIATMRA